MRLSNTRTYFQNSNSFSGTLARGGMMSVRGAFPALPLWLTAKRKNVPAELRPFGTAAEDLAADFHMARRPELITELLLLCASTADDQAIDQEFLLDMPVSLRISALITLAAITGQSPFSWQVRCRAADCGEQNEFDLTAAQIMSLAQEHIERETLSTAIEGVPAELRRPTGRDQKRWLAQPDADLSKAMVRSVLVRPPLDDLLSEGLSLDAIALHIDQTMDSFDLLLSLQLSVLCPQCGVSTEVSPDLAEAALERLSRAQRTAIADVHRLASRYHWSESEIIRLPQWRRQSYLELIEGGA
jgi:hypothetical protein